MSSADSESAREVAQITPLASWRGAMLRPFQGPRSSRFERVKRLCMFRMADCGLWRSAALTGLGRIADCTLDPLLCKCARTSAAALGSSPSSSLR
eukprot:11046287-Alexandrium_andersonii.AAC.1